MNNLKNVASNVPATTNERQVTNLHNATTSTGKNLTGKQLARKIASEKRKSTNDAGKLLVSAMREQMFSLPIIRQLFEYAPESVTFCEALSIETGKDIDVRAVLAIPMRQYLDYITDIEATRGMIRGITPAEFRNVIARYYRGERKAIIKTDADANVLLSHYTRSTDI